MTEVVNLLDFKYSQMNLDSLLTEAEACARKMEKGTLSKEEKAVCVAVFKETYKKADGINEVRDLMMALVQVMKFL